jgi:protein-L-isoaspartate(D-aspartate) O-methyltransferase
MSTIISSLKRRVDLLRAGRALALLALASLAQLPGLGARELSEEELARLRRRMVENDLKGRGIKDRRVLEAMASVPRHLFVKPEQRHLAYSDSPLPIGEGQTISQPYIVALMSELLELRGEERVLEIGTGSGYQAAVLSRLAREVYTIEILPGLGERARARLESLGYRNVEIRIGDGSFGWEEKAPFDAILVTAAAERIPEPLWAQLADGGRLVMPLGGQRQGQKLIRARKLGGGREIEEITGVAFVPMTGAARRGRP